MAHRELLQLAHTYKPESHKIAGWYISEHLNGTRCFWDGGLSRGVPTADVPWASITNPKTGKQKAKIKPVATGLWSRYGNPIMAPDWFLNCLPCCPLDGELWASQGCFHLCRSICGANTPDPRFDQIQYAVYGSPPLSYLFADGRIKNINMVRDIKLADVQEWIEKRLEALPDYQSVAAPATFDDELLFLCEAIETQNDRVFLHRQTKLPQDEHAARARVAAFLQEVVDRGGKGVVIRDPNARWVPKRSKGLLKYTPFDAFDAGRKDRCSRSREVVE